MFGDDINAALEEQERNKALKKQKEREKNINKNKQIKGNAPISNLSNNMMPIDSIPGDTIEPNIKNNMNNSQKNEIINQSSDKIKNKNKSKKIMIEPSQNISSFNNSNNYKNNNNIQENVIINRKKAIPIPKSNNKSNSKSPNRSRSPNNNNFSNNNNNNGHRKSNSNNIPDVSKEEIMKRIKDCLREVDPRYLNPSFNLMTEIINVFGDVNFEKVKQDIERLKQCNTKLDDVIKLIVDKHSDEFFQILGYVRETKNIIESSKIKYDYAQVSLGNLTNNVSSLAINENIDWKLQSIFLNEIISRLSKTLHIFEILHECEEYIRNDKLYDAMNIINKTKEEHQKYDKEFRNYNLLVTINIRFIHIQKEIDLKIITGLNQVIFFDEFKVKDEFYKEHKEKEVFIPLIQTLTEQNDENNNTNNTTNNNIKPENENSFKLNNFKNNSDSYILSKKISSLINYYINFFSKISIDTEIVKPINKFINIIEQVVNYKIEEELGLKFLSELDISVSANLNKVNYALNKRNTETLIYYIKCLREYNDESLLKLLNILIETINTSLTNFLCTTFEIITEKLKLLSPLLTKYNLEEKSDKIKFLLFLQIALTIIMHSLIKMATLIKYVIKSNRNLISINVDNLNEIKENENNNNIIVNSKQFKSITNKIYSAYEKCLIMILLTFHKNIISKSELTEGDIGNLNLSSSHSFHDFVDLETLLKRKISELTFLNFEHLSILYKLMDEIYFQCKDKYGIVFKDLKKYLTTGTSTIYKFYSNKLSVTKFFDLASFTFDYDTAINNFKFLEDLTNKIETLKKLYIFALDVGYKEIMKILRQLLIKYYDDQKNFLTKLKKDCIHRQLYNNLLEQLTNNKNNKDLMEELLINYQFRKYTLDDSNDTIKSKNNINNNMISTESSKNSIAEKYFHEQFKILTVNFIFDIIKSTKPSDQLVLLTRNYKLLELLTKFMVCNGSICLMIESFIFDLMNKQFETAKIVALMEQLKTVKLENMANDENIDLSSLIIMSILTLDNISQEKLKVLLLLKVEFCCLLIPLARNLIRNNYYLNEPQMTPEYFIISFISDFMMYCNLFQYSLEQEQYNFIMKDILLIINNIFIEAMSNMTNNINSYGANLLVRNFEYIKENLGGEMKFYDDEKENKRFENSIFYCTNYIKLLTVNENKVNDLVNKYFKVIPFDKNFIKPILDLKRNAKNRNNDMQIIKDNNISSYI